VAIAVKACDNVTATFAALQKGAVRVHAYYDRNGNGQQQEDEPGSKWWWTDLKVLERDGSESLVASNFGDEYGEWNVLGLVRSCDVTLSAPRTNTTAYVLPRYRGG
jgi:hypothetical protein